MTQWPRERDRVAHGGVNYAALVAARLAKRLEPRTTSLEVRAGAIERQRDA